MSTALMHEGGRKNGARCATVPVGEIFLNPDYAIGKRNETQKNKESANYGRFFCIIRLNKLLFLFLKIV
jgi:hypothetical protein